MKRMKDRWITKWIDWEEFGYRTMIEANEESGGIDVCKHQLHDYELQLGPRIKRLNAEIDGARGQYEALHVCLYGRPVPVDDASMLTHSIRTYIIFALSVFMAWASIAFSVATFRLSGSGMLAAIVGGICITVLPLTIGHLAYEKILSNYKSLQIVLLVLIATLGAAGYYEYGQARRVVFGKAMTQSTTSSYVDDDSANDPLNAMKTQDNGETKAKGSMGESAFLFACAAELGLGFLVGLFVKLRTDKDYAAWRRLKHIVKRIAGLDEQQTELCSRIERAKHQCMAGLRRAQDVRNKRQPPYHKALVVLALCLFFRALPSSAQIPDHLEGVLIDTSTSIARGGANRNLFQEYVASTKKVLRSEPPNARIWVLSIATDSFGGVREILKAWTPETHGVFSDDLDRARHQLTISFEAKSAVLTPTATGTDIFGGLWHLKTLFDSVARGDSPHAATRSIWIFSDMMNETREFPMPELLEIGPERMLERAKASGLLVPLPHYHIHVYGVSTSGLTPHSWIAIRRFWEMYFQAAGAELVTYSAECDVRR